MSADDAEEMRVMKARNRQRWRKQVQREMWEMVKDSTIESAADMVRWIFWIAVFIMLLTFMTPH